VASFFSSRTSRKISSNACFSICTYSVKLDTISKTTKILKTPANKQIATALTSTQLKTTPEAFTSAKTQYRIVITKKEVAYIKIRNNFFNLKNPTIYVFYTTNDNLLVVLESERNEQTTHKKNLGTYPFQFFKRI